MAPDSTASAADRGVPPPRVAFLGPLGTYSHQATSDFFGTCELVPQTRIADVFAAVSSGLTPFGLVPIENSSFGNVAETMEQLRTTALSGIGQCRGYLAERYPGAEIIPVNSTAQAAQEAFDDPEALAICSLKCAEVYDLDIVDKDIQDAGATNTTRFVVLAPSTVPLPPYYPMTRLGKLDEQTEQ